MKNKENKKRNKLIIDSNFQLRTTAKIVGSYLFISVLVIMIISICLNANNNRLANIITLQDNNTQTILAFSQNKQQLPTETINKVYSNHQKNIIELEKIITRDKQLVIFLIIFTIIQSIILAIILIRKTHRIAGPIYVLSQYINQILAGEEPEIRQLRKKDELQEFYQLFTQMIDKQCENKEEKENKE